MAKYTTKYIIHPDEVADRSWVSLVIRLRDRNRPFSKGWLSTRDFICSDVSWDDGMATTLATTYAGKLSLVHHEHVQFVSAVVSPWQGAPFFPRRANTYPVLFPPTYGQRSLADAGAQRPLNQVLLYKVSAPPGNLGELMFRGALGVGDIITNADETYTIAGDSPVAPGGDDDVAFRLAFQTVIVGDWSSAMIGREILSSEMLPAVGTAKPVLEVTLAPARARTIKEIANVGLGFKKYNGG